jgi:hypothetical protein
MKQRVMPRQANKGEHGKLRLSLLYIFCMSRARFFRNSSEETLDSMSAKFSNPSSLCGQISLPQ